MDEASSTSRERKRMIDSVQQQYLNIFINLRDREDILRQEMQATLAKVHELCADSAGVMDLLDEEYKARSDIVHDLRYFINDDFIVSIPEVDSVDQQTRENIIFLYSMLSRLHKLKNHSNGINELSKEEAIVVSDKLESLITDKPYYKFHRKSIEDIELFFNIIVDEIYEALKGKDEPIKKE